jgi:hypothetical protein
LNSIEVRILADILKLYWRCVVTYIPIASTYSEDGHYFVVETALDGDCFMGAFRVLEVSSSGQVMQAGKWVLDPCDLGWDMRIKKDGYAEIDGLLLKRHHVDVVYEWLRVEYPTSAAGFNFRVCDAEAFTHEEARVQL